MPPPKPKPKPREDLAKALAAASQWHFSTKNLSEKNRKAAEKNYRFVKQRIRETGGDLTPAEKTLAKGFRAERTALPPRPRPMQSGDASDRAHVARERNRSRGAAATGGMGQKERDRAMRAFTFPEKRARPALILRELQRQGFPEPKTEAQAQAQVKQLSKSINASQQAAYNRAAQHPFDLEKNTRLLGRQEAKDFARSTRKQIASTPPPPLTGWAGKAQRAYGAIGDAAEWALPERAEGPATALGGMAQESAMTLLPPGLRPIAGAASKDVKNLAGEFALAVPAMAEAVIKDILPGNKKFEGATGRMALEMGRGIVKGAEAAVPGLIMSRKTYSAAARGDWDEAWRLTQEDVRRAGTEWSTRPATSLLNTVGLVTVPTRLGSVGSLARSIGRANPHLSKVEVFRAAVKESYVPGFGEATGSWEGGIPKRMLRRRIVDPTDIDPKTGKPRLLSEGEPIQGRPPSRTPIGRGIQRGYDKWSRSDSAMGAGQIPFTQRWTELSRAVRAQNRRDKTNFEAQKTTVRREIKKVEKYIRRGGLGTAAMNVARGRLKENRARLAETFWVPQGPNNEASLTTLRAVADDLRNIAEEGGQQIPPNVKVSIDKELRRVDIRLERLGPTVDLSTGLWAEAANAMRKAGLPPPLIETVLAAASHRARVWAKNEPGRDPNDWLESEEGRNLAGIKFGSPEESAESLFQVLYPTNDDVPLWDGNPSRVNRVAVAEQRAAYDAAVARGEIDPATTPFVPDPPKKPPLSTGPAYGKSGRPVATHTTRHSQAAREIEDTVDENGNMLDGADKKLYDKVKKFLPNKKWRTTLQEKSDRMDDFYGALEKDQRELLSMWYERTWDYIAYIYGEDTAQAMGNAFYTGQAAQSPAAGIELIFKVAQRIANGEKAPGPKESFRTQNVWKLMTGEHLGENPTGIAAKLMDFFDAGAGMTMRTLLDDKAKFGGPGVVDRWTWRSDGYITPESDGLPPQMMAARIKNLVADKFLATNTGKMYAYEYSSMRLQKLTDKWNAERKYGRDDWRVEEIQAIDWFATKKEWVHKKYTRKDAEGGSPLDMAHHNTREIVFDGTPEQLERIIEEVGGTGDFRGVRPYKGIVKDEQGRRPEWFSVDAEGKTHALVIGATRSMDTLEEALAGKGLEATFRYPGEFGGVSANPEILKKTEQLDIRRDQRGDASETIKRLNLKDKERPQVFNLGADSYRLSFGTGKRARELAEEFAKELGVPMDQVVARTLRAEGTPEVLTQRFAQGVRGAVEFLDTTNGRQLLYLSEHADPSTFFHELFGHAAYEMKREYPAEFAKIEQRYGKELADWTEVEHEKLATEVERYLRSGKAPVDELKPLFALMKEWMTTVYYTVKALGRKPHKDTQRLMDAYFGKGALDFTPPQRLRRSNRLTTLADPDAVSRLVDETGDLLMRGADVLRGDPAARQRIAGNMKWIEQQILPYLDDADPALAARVHDLFGEFDEVKSGSSIFSADEQRLLAQQGRLLTKRHAQMNKMAEALNAQPDQGILDMGVEVMEELDAADTLEDLEKALPRLKDVVAEVDRRTNLDFESQRLLSRQVADIERAIDPDRPVNAKTKQQRDEAIGVVREISAQMKDMYMDVFGEGLGPEGLEMLRRTLDARDNLIPGRLRELGLLDEGTGEGSYVPHYSIFDRLTTVQRGPVRLPAAGGTRKILSQKVRNDRSTFARGTNKLRRYGKGTLQVDPRALFSAYRNRLRFLETSIMRKRLWDMAPEIPRDANGYPRIPEGWYILNGSGDTIPARLKAEAGMSRKEMDEVVAAGEDFDSRLQTEQGTVDELQKYRDQWLTDDESKATMSKEDGGWEGDELRMLPPEVVEGIVGKVFDSAPGGMLAPIFGMLSVGGRVATIFSHPMGYIHANVAANALLIAITQPSRAPRAVMEFFHLPGSLRASHPTVYDDITVLTGDVKADAGMPDFYVKSQNKAEWTERTLNRGARAWASFLGDISDQPFRVASWTGHARKYGYNTPEQWQDLIHSTDPDVAEIREIVSQRAREDMLDFNKLSPAEQRMARYLFIWPFIRASAAWPLWAVREYPGRMAVMANAAQAEERAVGDESVRARYNAVAPASERTMFDISEVPLFGGSINMGPVNPVSPLAEKITDFSALLQNPGQMKPVVGLFNPGFTTFGEGAFSPRGVDWAEVATSVIPGASFYRAWTDKSKRGAQKYDDRDSFLDYLRRREGRFWPEQVSAEKVKESGKKEAEKADTRPTWEKAQEKDMKDFDKIVAAAKKAGKRPPSPSETAAIKRSITAYNALDAAEAEWEKKTGKTDLDEWDKIQATYAVVEEYYPERYGSLPPLSEVRGWSKTKKKNANDMPTLRSDIRSKIQTRRSNAMSRGRAMGLDVG